MAPLPLAPILMAPILMAPILLACLGCGPSREPAASGPAPTPRLAAATPAAPRPGKPPVIWRFAIEESVGSVQHAYAVEFRRRIERRTNGQVQVVVYPYGTLGTSTQITEQLNLGVIELAMASPGSLGKFIPELQVFLLHFLLPESPQQTRTLLSDPSLVAELDQLYAPKGLKLMSLFSEGQMVWTTQHPIRSPADFRGVKMRVMTSPILLSAYAAYGASPTPMPYSEVYSGLQLNMIDGQVNPVFAIQRQKFHEVTDCLTFPGHAAFITTCATNRDFFEGLSPERQTLVTQIFRELDGYIFDVQTRLEGERLKQILRDKIRQQARLTVCGDLESFSASLSPQERRELIEENEYLQLLPGLSAAERSEFRQASRPVVDRFLGIGGPRAQEVLERLRRGATE